MHSTVTPARQPITRRAVVAWGIAGVDFAVFIASLFGWAAMGPVSLADVATFTTMPIAFGGVGALLSVRVPANPIGPLLLLTTTGLAVVTGAPVLAQAIPDPSAHKTLIAFLLLAADIAFIPSLLVTLIGIPLVFPNGRLLSGRWRAVILVATVAVIAPEISALVSTQGWDGFPGFINPLGNQTFADALAPIEQAAALIAIPVFASAFASLVLRYRRGDDVERHQIRWLAAALGVAVIAFSISFLAPADLRSIFETVGLVALIFTPVAIGIAIARYRLYEIDRLISRGISYGIVTVLLIAAYAASVLVLIGPLGAIFGESTIVVAISTLVVAALFQPVRMRVQRVVDRRFDRARIDGERTSAAFSKRLRDEVDMDAVVRDLAGTVDATVRPVAQALWLRGGGS